MLPNRKYRGALAPFLALLLVVMVLVACRDAAVPATAEPSELTYVPYSSETMGIALEYPESWTVQESFSGLTVASGEDVLQAESLANIGDGAFVVVLPIELDVFNFQTGQELGSGDVLPALATYLTLLEGEGQTFQVVEPPHAETINGQSAAVTVLTSEEEGVALRTTLAAIIDEGQLALISAASLQEGADAVTPVLDHIINSVEVMPAATGTQ